MICPKCGSSQIYCMDSRCQDGGVRRRKACRSCQHRFFTMEIPEDQFNAMKSREDLLKAFLYRAAQVAAEIEEINHISTFPNGDCK